MSAATCKPCESRGKPGVLAHRLVREGRETVPKCARCYLQNVPVLAPIGRDHPETQGPKLNVIETDLRPEEPGGDGPRKEQPMGEVNWAAVQADRNTRTLSGKELAAKYGITETQLYAKTRPGPKTHGEKACEIRCRERSNEWTRRGAERCFDSRSDRVVRAQARLALCRDRSAEIARGLMRGVKAAFKGADGRWWRSLGPATDALRASPEVVQWNGAAREMWGEIWVPHASPARHIPKKERTMATKAAERAVLVTTAHRGVFFGYAKDTAGATIKLRAARLCVYWTVDLRGFMGLASHGPGRGCKIGPAADIELRDITSVTEVAPAAAERWEKAPWNG